MKLDIETRVLYRDGLVLVIDKPAGLPVHAGPGGGSCLEDYFDALRFGLPRPPFLAHRLDRDTSGCLVLGRHRKALARLGRLFSQGKVDKRYWALVEGVPPSERGTINLPLVKRSTRARGWGVEVDQRAGRAARTDYHVLARARERSLVELCPHTGRTHQLRMHLAALGCPVVGDPKYGRAAPGAGREPLMLRARSIALPLYPRREPICVEAPLPEHLCGALLAAGLGLAPDATVAPSAERRSH